MIRLNFLGIFVLVALTSLVGCSQLTVQKAGKDTKEKDRALGQSFYLPKVIMNLIPDKNLGYIVKWEILPDRSQEYRIAYSASWASTDIKIETEGGLLKSIKSYSDTGIVAKDAVDAVSAAREAQLAADLAVAKAKRTDADAALTAAKTELTSLEGKVSAAEAAIVNTSAVKKFKEIEYNSAKKEADLQRINYTRLETKLQEATESKDPLKITSAENALDAATRELIKADAALEKLGYELQAASTAYDAAMTNKNTMVTLLNEAKANVHKLVVELPDKPVTVTLAADLAADTTETKPVQQKAWIAAPVMFWVDTGADDGKLLKPINMTVNSVETKYDTANTDGTRITQSKLLSIGVNQISTPGKANANCSSSNIGEAKAAISPPVDSLVVATITWNCEVLDPTAASLKLQSVANGNLEALSPLVQAKAGANVKIGEYSIEKQQGRTIFKIGLDQTVLKGQKCTGANSCQIYIKEKAPADSISSTSIIKVL
jgi:hypothetical protein